MPREQRPDRILREPGCLPPPDRPPEPLGIAVETGLLQSVDGVLLRTNLVGKPEQELWHTCMQLNDAEAAFRTLKQDLSIRPIRHQLEHRVEAHVLVCFLAYTMYRTLDRMSRDRGVGLSARKILGRLGTIKSGDVILPLVDGRELHLRRVSRPDQPQAQLLAQLGIGLPERVGRDQVSGKM